MIQKQCLLWWGLVCHTAEMEWSRQRAQRRERAAVKSSDSAMASDRQLISQNNMEHNVRIPAWMCCMMKGEIWRTGMEGEVWGECVSEGVVCCVAVESWKAVAVGGRELCVLLCVMVEVQWGEAHCASTCLRNSPVLLNTEEKPRHYWTPRHPVPTVVLLNSHFCLVTRGSCMRVLQKVLLN